jgi:DNA-binding XRE family transcriptional regulator
MSITPQQVKAARRLLGWSQPTLATKARISRETVLAFEKGRRRASDDSMFEMTG